jgi:hypothetical protein
MLQVLEDHFRPSSISNTFATLLSLFNDRQSNMEGIHQFHSCFEGHLLALSCSLVAIPPILQVMLFLWAIHSRYQDLLNQFASKQKICHLPQLILWWPTLNIWMNLLWLGQMAKQSVPYTLPVLRPRQQQLPTAAVGSIAPRGRGYLHWNHLVFCLAGVGPSKEVSTAASATQKTIITHSNIPCSLS